MLSAKLSTTMHALLRRATDRCGHRPSKNKATTPALLRRATGRFCRLPSKLDATTHAPREGGTIIICSAAATGYNSNSRSPAESDLGTMVSVRKGMRYNSRSPAESDCHALYSYRPTGRLQLPLSCGERHENKTACFRPILLQLTLSPAESDVNKLLLPANDIATTPALLRRATVIDDFAVHSNAATTPALLRRATAQCKLFHGKTQSYNSRSPAESDAYASAS